MTHVPNCVHAQVHKSSMASVRAATMNDMIDIQHCNLLCLPENYHLKYHMYHLAAYPQVPLSCCSVMHMV